MTPSIFLILTLFAISANCFRTKLEKSCICVPFQDCLDDEDSESDGAGLLDIRKLETNQCPNHFEICCTKFSPPTVTEKDEQLNNGCGYPVNDVFPWSHALFHRKNPSEPHQFKCGVSFIHDDVAITAAHCFKVSDGTYSIRTGHGVIRKTAKVITHFDFDAKSFRHDIALVILKPAPPTAPKITPICIPMKDSPMEASCKIPVWIQYITPKKLFIYSKNIELQLVEREMCEKKLQSSGAVFKLDEEAMCAEGKQYPEVCRGKDGSGLVCPIPQQPHRYYQVGIASWSVGCGAGKFPGVYVKLSEYRDWIDSEMRRLGFCTHTYTY